MRAAPLSRRLVAYLLDWLFGATACAMFVAFAATVLLWSSDLNRHDPSAPSLYAAIAILALGAPVWLLYTALTWAWFGATAGMALAGVRIVSHSGQPPGVWQSAERALWMVVLTTPALVSPTVASLAASLGTIGPLQLSVPIAIAAIISASACASPLLSPTRRAWHDRLSGTWVVSTARARRRS